ncbi:MAG: hypothetical protein JWM16_6212 [Verrucomicrobiales bacterium]|nr:hypothetical protein [Verrucomicrobiales bacterium]
MVRLFHTWTGFAIRGVTRGDWSHEQRESDGLVVANACEVPANQSGEVLHINDHGNATLYAAGRGRLVELLAAFSSTAGSARGNRKSETHSSMSVRTAGDGMVEHLVYTEFRAIFTR